MSLNAFINSLEKEIYFLKHRKIVKWGEKLPLVLLFYNEESCAEFIYNLILARFKKRFIGTDQTCSVRLQINDKVR